MRAGKLNRRLTLLQRVVTKNDFGESIETFPELATVWGEQMTVSGNERWVAQQRVAEITHLFSIRYRADISPLNRFIFHGKEYDILSVIPIGNCCEGLAIGGKARAE